MLSRNFSQCMTPQQGIDYNGADLGSGWGESYASCCDQCSALDKCVAYTFDTSDQKDGDAWGEGASSFGLRVWALTRSEQCW